MDNTVDTRILFGVTIPVALVIGGFIIMSVIWCRKRNKEKKEKKLKEGKRRLANMKIASHQAAANPHHNTLDWVMNLPPADTAKLGPLVAPSVTNESIGTKQHWMWKPSQDPGPGYVNQITANSFTKTNVRKMSTVSGANEVQEQTINFEGDDSKMIDSIVITGIDDYHTNTKASEYAKAVVRSAATTTVTQSSLVDSVWNRLEADTAVVGKMPEVEKKQIADVGVQVTEMVTSGTQYDENISGDAESLRIGSRGPASRGTTIDDERWSTVSLEGSLRITDFSLFEMENGGQPTKQQVDDANRRRYKKNVQADGKTATNKAPRYIANKVQKQQENNHPGSILQPNLRAHFSQDVLDHDAAKEELETLDRLDRAIAVGITRSMDVSDAEEEPPADYGYDIGYTEPIADYDEGQMSPRDTQQTGYIYSNVKKFTRPVENDITTTTMTVTDTSRISHHGALRSRVLEPSPDYEKIKTTDLVPEDTDSLIYSQDGRRGIFWW